MPSFAMATSSSASDRPVTTTTGRRFETPGTTMIVGPSSCLQSSRDRPSGDVRDGADNEIETVLGGILEFHHRLGKPSRQRDALNRAANPLHGLRLEQALAVEHDADRHDTVGARSDRGDIGGIGEAGGAVREHQSRLGGIDAGP